MHNHSSPSQASPHYSSSFLPFLNLAEPTSRLSSPNSSSSLTEALLSQTPPSSPSSSSSRFISQKLPLFYLFLVLLIFSTTLFLRLTPLFHVPHPNNSNTHQRARIPTGYALVAACTNRHNTLEKALLTWLTVKHVQQIVIVDWASSPPLKPIIHKLIANKSSQHQNFPKLTVVRVQHEQHWVLTRAYNLAVRLAEYAYIFKLDCDYLLSENAIENHSLRQNHSDIFYSGYYMNARDANEMHLNGALVVSQKSFWAVGGYDERIQTYGYDDEDLYKRLTASGLRRLNVTYEHVGHVEHPDAARAQSGVRFPRAQIDMNALILEKLGKPWGKEERTSEYERVAGQEDVLQAVYIPPAIETLVPIHEREQSWRLSIARRLRGDYKIPWAVISSMEIKQMEKLLGNMNVRKARGDYDEVKHSGLAVRYVMIHVQNGLGNRLRVVASGLSFAQRTDREPILVWEKDVHFRGFYGDIFNESQTTFAVLNRFEPNWPIEPYGESDDAWKDVAFYNYLTKEDVGKEVVDDKNRNIYFKSSAIMNTEVTTWESENEQLRSLKVHGYITGMATRVTNNKKFKAVCGVHIRNRYLDEDILGVKDNREMYHEDDAASVDKWRATSKYTNFVEEMKGLLNNGTIAKFFIASDTVEVLKKMEGLFPEGKVMYIERNCDDRSGKCEQYAMADVIVLSRTQVLLGSTWSSFTEAAMRLGGPKALMAGTDFGKPPEEEDSDQKQPETNKQPETGKPEETNGPSR